jgi:LPXTG-motif cell wall-anchored protein
MRKATKLAVATFVAMILAFTPTAAFADNSADKISTSEYPAGIFLDSVGNVFIADNSGHRLVVYPHGTGSVSLFGTTFTGGEESSFTLPDGVVAPKGVAVDPVSGALFFTEFSGKVWAISTRTVSLFGTTIDQAHINNFVEIATIPRAKGAIAFDADGNLFAAGEDSGEIQVLPRTANIFGNTYPINVPSQLVQAQQFAADDDFLADIAFDHSGNLYVTAMFGNTTGVHVLSAGASTLFGHAVSTSTFTSLTEGSGVLNPCGIDIDSAGRVYFGDWGQNKVFELSAQTENVFDVPLTANVASSIPSFDGLANQGIAVRPNGLVLYSGALDGTYKLVNFSPAWTTLRANENEVLANTGSNTSLLIMTALILVAGGLVLRRSRNSN